MRRRLLIALLTLGLVAAACGDDEPSADQAGPTTTPAADTTASTAPPTTTAPTTTAAPATTVATAIRYTGIDGVESTITDSSRIVSLSGDFTEILFELGAGDRVVAIDVTTTFPAPAADLPVIGFAQDLAPEPVLAMEPTLVLANELTAPQESIDQLRAVGVPVVVLASGASLDDVRPKILGIAAITGLDDAGIDLADRVDAEIQAALAVADQATEHPRVAFVYSRGPQLILLFGLGMATNAMLEGAGAVDVGAESGVFGAQPLTPEAIVAAAPEIIVLPAAGFGALGGPAAFLDVPGIAETPAGENQAFLAYDEAYFFNLGPRVGQALMEFILDLYPELAPDA